MDIPPIMTAASPTNGVNVVAKIGVFRNR